MSSPFRAAMMLGIAVETTVCSSDATVIASKSAMVTILRSARDPRVGVDVSAASDCNPAMERSPALDGHDPGPDHHVTRANRGHSSVHAKGEAGLGAQT